MAKDRMFVEVSPVVGAEFRKRLKRYSTTDLEQYRALLNLVTTDPLYTGLGLETQKRILDEYLAQHE